MEVKDLPSISVTPENDAPNSQATSSKSTKTGSPSDASQSIPNADAAIVSSSSKASENQTQTADSNVPAPGDSVVVAVGNAKDADPREQINKSLNALNVASGSVGDIETLLHSIGGILEQITNRDLPQQRKDILEKEANQLVDEIKKRAQTAAPDGSKPLAGDPIRLDVEQKLGKTLDLILPDEATDAFGIGKIKFSQKESIINTVVSVAEAKARIDKLREAVDSARKQVTETANTIDVAAQNREASQVSVRDVDAALSLTGKTGVNIKANPEAAMKSVGKFRDGILDLLRS